MTLFAESDFNLPPNCSPEAGFDHHNRHTVQDSFQIIGVRDVVSFLKWNFIFFLSFDEFLKFHCIGYRMVFIIIGHDIIRLVGQVESR